MDRKGDNNVIPSRAVAWFRTTAFSHLLAILFLAFAIPAWPEAGDLHFAPTATVKEAVHSADAKQRDAAVLAAADTVLTVLRDRDGSGLAALAHPEKGVRFSPYSSVDTDKDLVFSRAQLKTFWEDPQRYVWGIYDGLDPDPQEDGEKAKINLTPQKYHERFIMDRDFSNPSRVSVDDDQTYGNMRNNAASVYPDGTWVEYYIAASEYEATPEEGEFRGFDWAALRLVFEPCKERWCLVGVIHDDWTP